MVLREAFEWRPYLALALLIISYIYFGSYKRDSKNDFFTKRQKNINHVNGWHLHCPELGTPVSNSGRFLLPGFNSFPLQAGIL